MSDTNWIIAELAELRRLVHLGSGTPARVIEVKPGMARVALGAKDPSKATEDGPGEGNENESHWIRTGQHVGMVASHVPFSVGQLVSLFAFSGDMASAVLKPYTHNDNNPIDKSATVEAHTTRYRKKAEGGEEGSYKDDDEDHQASQSHDKHSRKIGPTNLFEQTRDQTQHKVNEKDGKTVATITHKAGQVLRELLAGSAKSLVKHTAADVLHQVGEKAKTLLTGNDLLHQIGDKAKVLLNAESLLHQIGDQAKSLLTANSLLHQIGDAKSLFDPSSIKHLVGGAVSSWSADSIKHLVGSVGSTISPESILHQFGNVKSILSVDGIKHLVGGAGASISSAGVNMLGSILTHNGVNVGGSHTHGVDLGKLGFFLTQFPTGGNSGGGGGGGGGGGDPAPQQPSGTAVIDGLLDSAALAWGGYAVTSSDPAQPVVTKGAQAGVLGYDRLTATRTRVRMKTAAPNTEYQVFVGSNDGKAMVTFWATGNFEITAGEGIPGRVWFRVYA
jgi:hypothetical protein